VLHGDAILLGEKITERPLSMGEIGRVVTLILDKGRLRCGPQKNLTLPP